MDRKVMVFGVQAVILAVALLALAGCSDTDPAPADAPKVATNQAQATVTSEPAPTPRPAPAQPVPTPEPVSSNQPASAPTPDPLGDTILEYSVQLLKRDPASQIHDSIFTMKWVEDGVADTEKEHLVLLLEIAVYLENIAQDVVQVPWVRDGLDEVEDRAILKLGGVADHSEEAARIIMEMDWFNDGVDEGESWVINAFNNIVRGDPDVAVRTLELPWFADGINEHENTALVALGRAAHYDWNVARRVLELPWFTDGVDDEDESWVFNAFGNLTEHNSDATIRMMDTPWFADGLDEHEALAVRAFGGIAYDSGPVAERVSNLPWFMDGPDKTESWVIKSLDRIVNQDPDGTTQIMDAPWFRDGLNHYEARSVVHIGGISEDRGEAALRIIGMPFLNSLEQSDEVALESLLLIMDDDPTDFDSLMSHPTITDGITDDETPLIALLHYVIRYNPALTDELLDPNQALVEDRAISLPLAGETRLTIVRTQPGAPRSMDVLERSVHAVEDYMNVPFPTNFVLLLYTDALPEGSKAASASSGVVLHPQYDVDDDSEWAEPASITLAEQVAHYYWHGGPLWLDRGAASLLASVAQDHDTPMQPNIPPCVIAENIASLEPVDWSDVNDIHDCHSALGARLFLDLRRALGEDEFQKGFRTLYLSVDEFADIEVIPPRSVEHLRDAFNFSPAATDTVIPRWYDGSADRDK